MSRVTNAIDGTAVELRHILDKQLQHVEDVTPAQLNQWHARLINTLDDWFIENESGDDN